MMKMLKQSMKIMPQRIWIAEEGDWATKQAKVAELLSIFIKEKTKIVCKDN